MKSPSAAPAQPMTVEEYARFDEPDDGYSSELFRGIIIREPDVAILLERRSWEGESGSWIRGAPDVAVEVLSPSNTPEAMLEKMRDYFNAGALRVWTVDPKARTVTIHRADGSETIFREGDRLEYLDVLPGFALEVRELFEG